MNRCIAGMRRYSGKYRVVSHRCAISILLMLLLMTHPVSVPAAGSADEGQLKAVIVFYFAELTSWPANAGSAGDATTTICVHGATPIAHYLTALSEEAAGKRHLAVVDAIASAGIRQCRLLYIAGPETQPLTTLIAASDGYPILTMSDAPGFIEQGGMVQLYKEKDKLRLLINLRKVESAQLSISSRILALAKIVGR